MTSIRHLTLPINVTYNIHLSAIIQLQTKSPASYSRDPRLRNLFNFPRCELKEYLFIVYMSKYVQRGYRSDIMAINYWFISVKSNHTLQWTDLYCTWILWSTMFLISSRKYYLISMSILQYSIMSTNQREIVIVQSTFQCICILIYIIDIPSTNV